MPDAQNPEFKDLVSPLNMCNIIRKISNNKITVIHYDRYCNGYVQGMQKVLYQCK